MCEMFTSVSYVKSVLCRLVLYIVSVFNCICAIVCVGWMYDCMCIVKYSISLCYLVNIDKFGKKTLMTGIIYDLQTLPTDADFAVNVIIHLHTHTVYPKIFTNDLVGKFSEPIRNAKFTPVKIFAYHKQTIMVSLYLGLDLWKQNENHW